MEQSGLITSASVTWIDRPPYWLQRTRRIWAADMGEPFPFVEDGRQIGRVIIAGPDAGFYPNGAARAPHDREAQRREKEQNRNTKW